MVSTSGLPTRHLALMVIEMMMMMVTISLQLPWSSETERACCSGGDWRWNWALPHITRSSVGKPIGLLSSPGGDDDHNDSIAEQEWWQWGIFKDHCCWKKDLIVILCYPKMMMVFSMKMLPNHCHDSKLPPSSPSLSPWRSCTRGSWWVALRGVRQAQADDFHDDLLLLDHQGILSDKKRFRKGIVMIWMMMAMIM